MSCDPNRTLMPTPEAEVIFTRWIKQLNDEFTRHQGYERRCDIVRDELFQLFLDKPHGGRINSTLKSELPMNVVETTLDPRNVTLEAEYLDGIDHDRYMDRKPLIFMWQMFDRSPLGLNLWLGFKFRCMMGHHIFKQMGCRVKVHHAVHFHFGYNVSLGDDVVIHRGATLDDRAELVLPAGSSVDAFATVNAAGQNHAIVEHEY